MTSIRYRLQLLLNILKILLVFWGGPSIYTFAVNNTKTGILNLRHVTVTITVSTTIQNEVILFYNHKIGESFTNIQLLFYFNDFLIIIITSNHMYGVI